jgi:DNA/RNA-binding domain of Phe-tRNA-synthetase-like protein
MFSVSDECIRLGLRSGAVVFRNVRIEPATPPLRSEIAHEVEVIRATLADPTAIRALSEVVAFQEILKKVGVNPRKEQPSVERLLAGALKRGDLPAINSLVDAYNLISVRSRCSMGAHDLDAFSPPVALRILTGQETFTPLGKTEPAPVTAGEFGYVDAADRLLCRLDLLQADFSKVTTQTTNALLIIEGTVAHAPEKLRQTFSDAIELITRYCGGTAEIVSCPV